MEQKITAREIMIFILKFNLMDAYFETELMGTDAIDFRQSGYGCDECSYVLYSNGRYEIEAWIEEGKESGHWEEVESGDIFELIDGIKEKIND